MSSSLGREKGMEEVLVTLVSLSCAWMRTTSKAGDQPYLQEPVKGPKATALGRAISAHCVHVDTLLQESV
jgi:hypothetical protein